MTDHITRDVIAGKLTASTFGILAGIGGLTHAIGEIRQGNIPTGGYMIDSWTTGPIATHMDGDPALTLIPNVLATGILALMVSTAIIVWSAFYAGGNHGGRNLILLSMLLLLVGGGVGSPIIGLLAGWSGTTIHAPLTRWQKLLPDKTQSALARMWPWAIAISATTGVLLVIGAPLLIYTVGAGNADVYFGVFVLTVVSLFVTVITGIAHDLIHHRPGVAHDSELESTSATHTASARRRS